MKYASSASRVRFCASGVLMRPFFSAAFSSSLLPPPRFAAEVAHGDRDGVLGDAAGRCAAVVAAEGHAGRRVGGVRVLLGAAGAGVRPRDAAGRRRRGRVRLAALRGGRGAGRRPRRSASGLGGGGPGPRRGRARGCGSGAGAGGPGLSARGGARGGVRRLSGRRGSTPALSPPPPVSSGADASWPTFTASSAWAAGRLGTSIVSSRRTATRPASGPYPRRIRRVGAPERARRASPGRVGRFRHRSDGMRPDGKKLPRVGNVLGRVVPRP